MAFRLVKFIAGAAGGARAELQEQAAHRLRMEQQEAEAAARERQVEIAGQQQLEQISTRGGIQSQLQAEQGQIQQQLQTADAATRAQLLERQGQIDQALKQISGQQRLEQIGAQGEQEELKTQILAEREKALTLARENAKASVDMAGDAMKQLGAVEESIALLNEGLEAMAEGAWTGKFVSKLPTVRAASIQLENVKNRLGLNIVSLAKFGQLTEKELRLALDTALPDSMSEEKLRNWMEDKRAAQRKARDALRDAAQFFGSGGTIADLLAKDRGGKAAEGGDEYSSLRADLGM